jgi:RNA polymerase sigma factor (sigma-70 family)
MQGEPGLHKCPAVLYDVCIPTPFLEGILRAEGAGVSAGRGPSSPGSSLEAEATISLVHRARDGDAAALDELCRRYLPRLQRWASGRLPGYARSLLATDDLVQDALLQTVSHIGGLRAEREGAFQVYVRQILLNRIRDQVRRPQVVSATVELPESTDQAPSPLEEVIGRDTLERYEQALARLRPEDREAVVARVEMASGYQELAGVLGKPSADAARMAVARALVRLAKEMGHEG